MCAALLSCSLLCALLGRAALPAKRGTGQGQALIRKGCNPSVSKSPRSLGNHHFEGNNETRGSTRIPEVVSLVPRPRSVPQQSASLATRAPRQAERKPVPGRHISSGPLATSIADSMADSGENVAAIATSHAANTFQTGWHISCAKALCICRKRARILPPIWLASTGGGISGASGAVSPRGWCATNGPAIRKPAPPG